MLKNLLIQNYALIDHLEIELYPGLNIITGETGAGKSILLGALGLILGNRADANVLKDKSKGCVVEGVFNISSYNLEEFFTSNDLDYLDNTIIRRNINSAGKSRAFVNELPVTLNLLKDLVSQIIDIHSQHQNLLLANSNFQLSVLDSFAGNSLRVLEYNELFRKYKELHAELDELKDKSGKAKADFDYLQFQLNQLDEAKLVVGEELELETLQQQLMHAEEIKTSLKSAANFLNADEMSVIIWLKDTEALLSKISNFFQPGQELADRVEACRIELKDIAHEVDFQSEKLELDPLQLETVNQRLDLILSLHQKHRVNSTAELIDIRENLRMQVDEITNYDLIVEIKTKELDALENKAMQLAKEINTFRTNASASFENSIKSLLLQLGMPHAGFKVNFIQHNELQLNGIDKVSFLFTANKQIPLQELSKVASGGELSRLMLSLKSLLVKTKGLPTIILDEIDTGVSGEVADKVGNIINDMSKEMQVINITHLPQIASKGSRHFLVYKDNEKETSRTEIRLLSNEERIVEIAKMLSGEKISDAALTNAKHLLASNMEN
jgi:DNA repair protein RecN (Recombination protein N)